MGVVLSSERKQSQKIYADRMAVGRNALFAAKGLGSHNVPVTPKVLGKLYWSVSIPRMTYGLEATPISARELDELEQAHRQHAKIVQGLSRSSPNPAVLATMGWLSLSAHISKIKLVFLWRILCLPGNVYKDVVLTILNKCFQCKNYVNIDTGPIQDMYKAVCKYNMKDELIRCIQMGEYGNISERKRLIKRIVWEHERCSWRASCLMYPSLDIYCQTVEDIRLHTWWTYADKFPHFTAKISTVMSLLLGTQSKGTNEKAYKKKSCELCDEHYVETASHVLFKYPCLHKKRAEIFPKLTENMPSAMAGVFNTHEHNAHNVTSLMLSGLRGRYVPEWFDIYAAIATYIGEMFSERNKLIDNKNEPVHGQIHDWLLSD